MSTHEHLDKLLYLFIEVKGVVRAMVRMQEIAKMHILKMSFA